MDNQYSEETRNEHPEEETETVLPEEETEAVLPEEEACADETPACGEAAYEDAASEDLAPEAPEGEGEVKAARFDFARELCEWLEVAVTALTAVILIFTFLGRVATVDGTSMLPTLTHGEKLIVQEIAYEPEQGDIVICQSATWGMENPLVKRVIALEGQTITVNFATWEVFVDGEKLDEPYINYLSGVWMNGWDYGESYTVPEGHVFVMGDNRNNSRDSRRTEVGPIDKRLLLGRAVMGFSKVHGIRIFI